MHWVENAKHIGQRSPVGQGRGGGGSSACPWDAALMALSFWKVGQEKDLLLGGYHSPQNLGFLWKSPGAEELAECVAWQWSPHILITLTLTLASSLSLLPPGLLWISTTSCLSPLRYTPLRLTPNSACPMPLTPSLHLMISAPFLL